MHLKEHASVDPLTGLLNKRMLDRLFNEEWRSACRMKDELSLIVLDIDHFKKYNDQYGHSEGDECLSQVARALQSSAARPKDLVARFGGEEFVILLPDTDLQGGISVANKIMTLISELNIPHNDMKILAE